MNRATYCKEGNFRNKCFRCGDIGHIENDCIATESLISKQEIINKKESQKITNKKRHHPENSNREICIVL